MKMTVLEPGPLTGNALTGLEWKDVQLPAEPTLDQLRNYIAPVVPNFEHVSVLFQGHQADMFVDEKSQINGLESNEAATMVYWTNRIIHRLTEADPTLRGLTLDELCRRALDVAKDELRSSSAPAIAGPAVLFEKRVWF